MVRYPVCRPCKVFIFGIPQTSSRPNLPESAGPAYLVWVWWSILTFDVRAPGHISSHHQDFSRYRDSDEVSCWWWAKCSVNTVVIHDVCVCVHNPTITCYTYFQLSHFCVNYLFSHVGNRDWWLSPDVDHAAINSSELCIVWYFSRQNCEKNIFIAGLIYWCNLCAIVNNVWVLHLCSNHRNTI